MIQITVLVNIYNEESNLDDFFSSLVNQTYKDFSILVIDDGSTDRSLEIVDTYAKSFQMDVIKLEHVGLTKARKKGFDAIGSGFVAIFDADEVFDSRYLEKFVRTYEHCKQKGEDCFFWGGRIMPYVSKNRRGKRLAEMLGYVDLLLYYMQYDPLHMTIGTLIGGNMIVDKHEVNKLGGLRDDVIEDTELSERITKSGKKIYSDDQAIVYHKYPTSLKKLLKREYKSGYLIKDQKKITKKIFLRLSSLLIIPFLLYYWYYFFLLIKYTKSFSWKYFVVPWFFFLFFISRDVGYIKNLGNH